VARMSASTAVSTDLIATCWTSAGDVTPMAPSELSPHDVLERVQAVADTGWSGIGIGYHDLKHVDETIGFSALRDAIVDAGLTYTEVELIDGWRQDADQGDTSDHVRDLLFRAATDLDAIHVKIATLVGPVRDDVDWFVDSLRGLADHAAERGVRLALESMPYTMLGSVPQAADLVRAVDRDNLGLLIDSWHVFRAGTTLEDLRKSLTADIIFGVELDDAAELPIGVLLEDSINERLLCGEGTFDLVGLVQTLVDIGFRGPWGTEIISRTHRGLPLFEALHKARSATASVLSSALSKHSTCWSLPKNPR
jgi:sugar phosphate isomerase/epimerase